MPEHKGPFLQGLRRASVIFMEVQNYEKGKKTLGSSFGSPHDLRLGKHFIICLP